MTKLTKGRGAIALERLANAFGIPIDNFPDYVEHCKRFENGEDSGHVNVQGLKVKFKYRGNDVSS